MSTDAQQLSLFEPDRAVPDAELGALWQTQRQQGRIFNGVTDVDLKARYGERLSYLWGHGWFVRPIASVHLYAH
jgi:hypothetical protein